MVLTIFRRENFVATVTFVRLLSGTMNHDFVSPVVSDAGEILVTFVASVQNLDNIHEIRGIIAA